MKLFFLTASDLISFFWRLIPSKIRNFIFTALFILESRGKNNEKSLARLFGIKDKLDWVINERAMKYGFGIHPKHKLINYHSFFVENILDGEKVIDVGCGYGEVARSIAKLRPKSKVLGVDINLENIKKALHAANPANLTFINEDARNFKKRDSFDVVVLSNVLEHIDERILFLKSLNKSTKASKFLIRVPMFERDWQVAMRKELGVYYFSDLDHKIEHSLDEFFNEVKLAGLKAVSVKTIWGEIWAVCLDSVSDE
jgi:2-polyprenyl-3-methyl-5-hydroxy-6-metoxy-1,4-benzoquinol methylase